MSDGAVSITVDWTPGLLQDGNKAFRRTAPKRTMWLTIGWLGLCFMVAYVFGDDLLRTIRGETAPPSGAYASGHGDGMLSVLMAALLCLAGLPLLNRLAVREFYTETPYFDRPWTMELSVHGIRSRGPYNTGMIEWPAIVGVVRTKSSIVLSLGGGGFVPLPHAGLPDGMTPDLLMERIETWRSAADF